MLVGSTPTSSQPPHGDGPLLIVAGAGTGKTATLVPPRRHLIERGADPRRILLLARSRRAAAEMLRRSRRRCGARPRLRGATARISGGTFHAGAARLLRIHARDIGMQPEVHHHGPRRQRGSHPRRAHASGPRPWRRALPQKSTSLDVYSRCVDAPAAVARGARPRASPGACRPRRVWRSLFAAYTDPRRSSGAGPRRPAALLRGLLADPAGAPRPRALRPRARRRVPGHRTRCRPTSSACCARTAAGVTCVGDDAQAIYRFRAATVRNILDFEQRFPGARGRHPRRGTPQHGADPRRHQRADRRGGRAPGQGALDGPGRRRSPVLATCRRRGRADAVVWRARPGASREQGTPLEQQAVPSAPSATPGARDGAQPPRHSRSTSTAACGSSRWRTSRTSSASCGFAENPRDAMAGLRVLGLTGIGPKTAAAPFESLSAAGGDFTAAWAGARGPEPARAAWPAVVELFGSLDRGRRARRACAGPCRAQRLRTCSSAATTTSRRACATSSRSRAWLPARRRARSSSPICVLDPPRTRRSSPARLCSTRITSSSAPCTRPGPRVRRRVRHPRRRRQHPFGHGHRQRRRDRGGATPAVRRLHAAPGSTCTSLIPALLHPALEQGRHARLRAALTVPERGRRRAFEQVQTGPEQTQPHEALSSASPRRPSAPACVGSGRRRRTPDGRSGSAAAGAVPPNAGCAPRDPVATA